MTDYTAGWLLTLLLFIPVFWPKRRKLKMETMHTPGPWKVGGPYPGVSVIYCIYPGCGGPDAEAPAYDVVCVLSQATEGKPAEIDLANARLIAAAPDLLEACIAADAKFQEMYASRTGRMPEAVEMVRSAIAKAKGQSK